MTTPKGSHNHLIHGGEGALSSLSQGRPFARYARETYLKTLADMGLTEDDLHGTIGLAAREVARQFTVSELFWQALMGAAESGDIKEFERFAKRFGWMSGKATKGLESYFDVIKDKDVIDYELVLKADNND